MSHTILCITSYYKGVEFITEAHQQGNKVILVTSQSLKSDSWPWDSIDEVYYMPDEPKYIWNMDHLIQGISHLLRHQEIHCVVALDDFDVEKGAEVREIFRIDGMGQTTQRYFRDKLAMRAKALNGGIPVPAFTPIFNNRQVGDYIVKVPGPWVLKPRSEASATGIKKIYNTNDLWTSIEQLGENRHDYLLESFRPGDVYHVDTVVYNGELQFSSCSKYLNPPMAVAHEGGVFRTMTLDDGHKDAKELTALNAQLLKIFGLRHGASHSEFIKGKEDGQWYFLETSSRVGGAYISDMVEVATGVNLWAEWAKVETAVLKNEKYKKPKKQKNAAGLLVCLAKEEHPNTDIIQDTTIARRLQKPYHIGLIFKDDSHQVVEQKLYQYEDLIRKDFLNILPPSDTPNN